MNHKTIVAWLYLVVGSFGLFCGVVIAGIYVTSASARSGRGFDFVVPLYLMLATLFFVPSFAGALALLKGRAWGRVLLILESVLMLLLIPIGTLLGGYALWALLAWEPKHHPAQVVPAVPSKETVAPGARTFAAAAASAERARITGLLVAMAGVAAGFVVVIGTGFKLSGDTMPREIGATYMPAFVVLVAALIGGVVYWRGQPRGMARNFGAERQRLRQVQQDFRAERAARMAALAADPVKSKYVALIERGEAWSDAQIDYNEDLARLATCVHLQPIERAMRTAGIQVKLEIAPNVSAPCRVDAEALQRHFYLPESVRYAEPPSYDRSVEDPPMAVVLCESCKSLIRVVHPLEAQPQTPVFPVTAGGSM